MNKRYATKSNKSYKAQQGRCRL